VRWAPSTLFRDEEVPRSGEQAALGQDLIDLIEALGLDRPVVAGYDWGGRAACVTAALRPDLVRGLVSCSGYNLFGPPSSVPGAPESEYQRWYQYFLYTERGRAMLEENRAGFCHFLWGLWSPGWDFSEQTFNQTAAYFDNPDFVDVVLHSCRHRPGLAPGDPALAELAHHLEHERPHISVPTIILTGEEGLRPSAAMMDRSRFGAEWESRSFPGVGHNFPQEAPQAMAKAVVDLAR
jgi:pimeloyl-ACP methyl ester carboxylesterase